MAGGQIKISAYKDDTVTDGSLQFSLYLCNNVSSTFIYFNDFPDCFKDIGYSVSTFPRDVDDTINFQIGRDDDSSAFYIGLDLFVYENTGRVGMHIIIDDHQPEPDYNRCEFFIVAEPASIKKLGTLMNTWDPKVTSEIVWDAE
jgi:hypothetical protein